MHIGKKNPMNTYHIDDNESGLVVNLEPTFSERNLGIQMTNVDLKFSEQTNIAVSKANRMIRLMKHTFSCIEIWKKLYTNYSPQSQPPSPV